MAEYEAAGQMKETKGQRERRRVPRLHVTFPVVVNWGRKQFRWLFREFSEYGILLNGSNKDMVGEEIQLKIGMDPKEKPIQVTGIVAYSTDTGVGVRFKNIAPEARLSLKQYVQARGIGITRK